MKLNEYKILDNFVPDLLFKFYYDYVNNPFFSWHYIHNISEEEEKEAEKAAGKTLNRSEKRKAARKSRKKK